MDVVTQQLTVTIKRIDKSLPLPTYATAGSVGFDLLCREDREISPRSLGLIPGNVIVQTPPGYMLMITLRSSTPRRKGLLIPHGLGFDSFPVWSTTHIKTRVSASFAFCGATLREARGFTVGVHGKRPALPTKVYRITI